MVARERWALAALTGVAGVTALWWLLALWPLPPAVPEWVVRARAVCFGQTASGLPDGGGWLLLVGQPLGMLGFLLVVWGGAVRSGLRAAGASAAGRATLAAAIGLAVVGAASAGWRVSSATAVARPVTDPPAGALARLDRVAPPLGLIDQRGDTVELGQFAGRSVLVTFAFAHCETVCPLVVQRTLALRRALAAHGPTAAVIVTLDPWRDVPARLPQLAGRWTLEADEYVLSGGVARVNQVLDAWGVPRTREPGSGDVVHPALAYLVSPAGRLVAQTTGDPAPLAGLIDAR